MCSRDFGEEGDHGGTGGFVSLFLVVFASSFVFFI